MQKMLITGGTVFVSRYAAEYFSKTFDVYVLNRNTRPQCKGVTLLEGDRHNLGDQLREYHFDVVLDITAYDAQDVTDLLDALGSFDDYILLSSSAVYPETSSQPFTEETEIGVNSIWGSYGTNKIAAETALQSRVPNCYILRPPYLYGPGNNVHREAFVFDCASRDRKFYLPGDGSLKLQFFHVEDLCRLIRLILQEHPRQHIWNAGNTEAITIKKWVTLCYNILGKSPEFVQVDRTMEQRNYFPFYAYEYCLDTEKQRTLLSNLKSMTDGLKECWEWYQSHADQVNKKPLMQYIDENLA